jgi:hypothetical protein
MATIRTVYEDADTDLCTWYNGQRAVAVESGGRIWVAYSRRAVVAPSYTFVCVAYSDDSGATWTEDLVISADGHQNYPAIALDSDEYLHLVWAGLDWGINSGHRNIQYRMRTDAGWQAQEAITDHNDIQDIPCIAIDSADQPHVIWLGLGWSVDPGYQVQYRMRTGAGWQAQEAVTDVGVSQGGPSLCIDGDDEIHAVWFGGGWSAGVQSVEYRKRTGAGWQVQETVADSDTDQSYPCIAADADNNLYVVWEAGDGVDSTIKYRRRSADDDDWDAEEEITAGARADYNPTIAVDTAGRRHVFWGSYGVDTWDYMDTLYRVKGPGGWGAIQNITAEAGGSDRYNYAHSVADDRPCVVWTLQTFPAGMQFDVLFACVALGRPRVYASVIG